MSLRVSAWAACLLGALYLGLPEVSAQTIREKMQKGLDLVQAGELEKAQALFEEIIREAPQHGSARLQLGRMALSRGDLDEAAKHLEIAADSQPQRAFLAWHLLGRVRYLKEDYEGARRAFEESVNKAPNFVPPRVMLADMAERQGDFWEAMAAYREILKLPTEPSGSQDVQARMANLARIMRAYDLAEAVLGEALEATPDDGALYYLFALIQKETGRAEAAVESCQKALGLGFESPGVYVTLGDLYYQSMELSKSIAALGKAVEMDPGAAESIASFALSSLTTEDFAALQSLLESHLEAYPDNLNTLYSLGVMYLRENKLEKAKEHFLHLERLAPDHTQVHYNLGLIHFREGREEEGQAAMARFQELKAKEQEEFELHNKAHRMRLEAKEALEAGASQKAIEIVAELIQDKTAELADVIAMCGAYMSIGKDAQAYSCFERTLEADPFNRDSLEGLARAAEKTSQIEVAERCRRRLTLLSVPSPKDPD